MASLFRIPPAMDDSSRTRCDTMIKLVENACSEMLLSPDWTLNMQIVDDLNREQDMVVLTEVIRILRKRLGSNNMMVLSVALTLAETLVKNCHDPVHREIASERFMAAVANIARTYSFKTNRQSLAIADQALDIIQAWGEAFLPRRREFPLFVETYHELRAEGLPFSAQYQSDRPPVLDPGAGSLLDRPDKVAGQSGKGTASAAKVASRSGERSGGGGGGRAAAAAAVGAPSFSPNDLRNLSVSDREIVATGASCSEMLEQVLHAAESRAEVRNSDITAEVVEQLKRAGPKISGIIEANGEGDAGMLEALFKVNDAVENVLRLYKDVVDGVKSVPLLPPSSYSSDIGTVSARMEDLSIGHLAGAKSAASKLRKSVPTLSGPPADRKKDGKSRASPSPTATGRGGGDADTLDLLSGFELDGASNSNVNKCAAAAAAAASAAPGADLFADFGAPPPAPAVTAGGSLAGFASAATSAAATAGGDWVVVGRGDVQAHGTPAAAPVAGGLYGQQQELNGSLAPPGASAADPAATRRQSLIANLGALYAGAPASNVNSSGSGGGVGASLVMNSGAQGLSGGGVGGPGMAAWGGGVSSGGNLGAGGVAASAAFGGVGGFHGWAGGAGFQAASSPLDAMDPFAGQAPFPQQQGQQEQLPQQQQQQQQPPPQQQYQPQLHLQPPYQQQPPLYTGSSMQPAQFPEQPPQGYPNPHQPRQQQQHF